MRKSSSYNGQEDGWLKECRQTCVACRIIGGTPTDMDLAVFSRLDTSPFTYLTRNPRDQQMKNTAKIVGITST